MFGLKLNQINGHKTLWPYQTCHSFRNTDVSSDRLEVGWQWSKFQVPRLSSNTSKSFNSLLFSFMASKLQVASLHPMQMVSMAQSARPRFEWVRWSCEPPAEIVIDGLPKKQALQAAKDDVTSLFGRSFQMEQKGLRLILTAEARPHRAFAVQSWAKETLAFLQSYYCPVFT